MTDPASALTAEDFFAAISESDPDHYAEVCARYPVQSEYRELRDREGGRKPTKWARPSGGVPREMKRVFTAAELDAIREQKREYLREWALDYALAKELADQGM